jgi:hypothetical protein
MLLQTEMSPCVDWLMKLGEAPPDIAENGSVIYRTHWRLVRTPLTMRAAPVLTSAMPAASLRATVPGAPGRHSPPPRREAGLHHVHNVKAAGTRSDEVCAQAALAALEITSESFAQSSPLLARSSSKRHAMKIEPVADTKPLPARSATPVAAAMAS